MMIFELVVCFESMNLGMIYIGMKNELMMMMNMNLGMIYIYS
ncbi:hypothetical protein Hanom_Chr05g00422071 [Helianthus anomalus]